MENEIDKIKEFAKEIKDKLYQNSYRENRSVLEVCEAARQMIEHKLKKENWVKKLIDEPDFRM